MNFPFRSAPILQVTIDMVISRNDISNLHLPTIIYNIFVTEEQQNFRLGSDLTDNVICSFFTGKKNEASEVQTLG